jgi:hypothetical protein
MRLGLAWILCLIVGAASAAAAGRPGPPCLCDPVATTAVASRQAPVTPTPPLAAWSTRPPEDAPLLRVVPVTGASLWGLRPGERSAAGRPDGPDQDLSALMTAEPGAVRFTLRRPSKVAAGVYDLAGRLVFDFPTLFLPAGTHTLRWGGRVSEGEAAPQGIYFVRVRLEDGQAAARKVVWKR